MSACCVQGAVLPVGEAVQRRRQGLQRGAQDGRRQREGALPEGAGSQGAQGESGEPFPGWPEVSERRRKAADGWTCSHQQKPGCNDPLVTPSDELICYCKTLT